MKVGELFVFLGFQVDDKQLKNFDKGIAGLTRQLDLTKVGAVAAVYAMDRFIESSVAGAVALHNFNQQTAISTQSLQQWQAAAQGANPALGVDQIAQSIQTLENNLLEIRKFGSGNASPFAWLKIDIAHGQNAIQVLEQLRDRVQSVDRITAVNLIQKMGLDPGFINILTKSKEEFDALVKGMTRNDDAIKALQRIGERIAQLKLSLKLFKDNMVADFAPAINKLIDLLELVGRTIAYTYNLFRDFADDSPDLFKGIAAGIGILVIALNPLKSLITGLLLLLADLYVYKKGGQSLIGELLGEQGESFKSGALAGSDRNSFMYKLMDGLDKIQSGELRKNNSTVNRNVTINNDISIAHPDGETIAERIVRQNQKALDQVDLNYGYTDQQYKGSGY